RGGLDPHLRVAAHLDEGSRERGEAVRDDVLDAAYASAEEDAAWSAGRGSHFHREFLRPEELEHAFDDEPALIATEDDDATGPERDPSARCDGRFTPDAERAASRLQVQLNRDAARELDQAALAFDDDLHALDLPTGEVERGDLDLVSTGIESDGGAPRRGSGVVVGNHAADANLARAASRSDTREKDRWRGDSSHIVARSLCPERRNESGNERHVARIEGAVQPHDREHVLTGADDRREILDRKTLHHSRFTIPRGDVGRAGRRARVVPPSDLGAVEPRGEAVVVIDLERQG